MAVKSPSNSVDSSPGYGQTRGDKLRTDISDFSPEHVPTWREVPQIHANAK